MLHRLWDRLWDLLWTAQGRSDLVFVVTAILTVVAAPAGVLRLITGVVLLVALVAFVLMTRGPGWVRQAAFLVCAAGSIASIYLSHNGIGEAPVLLCSLYAREIFPGDPGRWVTGVLGVAFGVAVAWVSRTPVGLFAGVAVPFLAVRRVEQAELKQERDRAVLLLAELEKARDAQAQAAALAERGRIAREMHDVLAHSLAGLSLQLQAVRAVASRENVGPAVTEPLDKAAELARTGVEEAKAVVGALRETPGGSTTPDLLGVFELAGLVERFPGSARLRVSGEPGALDPAVGHAIYRAVQESLTNSARYAPGSPVIVDLQWETDQLRVLITDSGPAMGIVATGQGSGQGLRGMRERLAAVGGAMTSRPDTTGWRTEITVPTAGTVGEVSPA